MASKLSTLVEVHKEGDVYVAVDLMSGVSDFGKTKKQAVEMLLKGIKERYEAIIEEAGRMHKSTFSHVEVSVNA